MTPTPMYMADTAGSGVEPPTGCVAVAGYVDGYASFGRLVARYGRTHHCVSIAVDSRDDAEFLDVEKGAAVISDVRPWIERQFARGVERPGIYAAESNMPAIREQLAGIQRSRYRLWVAAWPRNPDPWPHAPLAGYDAWQFYGTSSGPYDYSVLAPDFFPAPAKKKRRPAVRKKTVRQPTVAPSRKVTASGIAAGIGTAVFTYLQHHGVHLTAAEHLAVTGAIAVIAGYLQPESKAS